MKEFGSLDFCWGDLNKEEGKLGFVKKKLAKASTM
jgi:hypothetical protein